MGSIFNFWDRLIMLDKKNFLSIINVTIGIEWYKNLKEINMSKKKISFNQETLTKRVKSYFLWLISKKDYASASLEEKFIALLRKKTKAESWDVEQCDVKTAIENALSQLQRDGYQNDSRVREIIVNGAGKKSTRAINQRLHKLGLSPIEQINEEDEVEKAIRNIKSNDVFKLMQISQILEKNELTRAEQFEKEKELVQLKNKIVMKLVAKGFSYSMSDKALKEYLNRN